jgi:hypothetical protein
VAEIIDNSKLPWPSYLADFSYNCVKWGLLIAAAGIPSGFILSFMQGVGEIIGGISIIICLASLFIGLASSTVTLIGMLFYRFKIYGTGRALGVFVLTFFLFSIGWAIVQPALLNAKKLSERLLCESHIKGLSSALRMYANENNGQYPTPEKWSELLLEHSGSFNENAFWCRKEPKGSFSYAINKCLYQIELNEVPPEMVLLFEADLGCNGAGGPNDVVLRHKRDNQLGCYISFVVKDEGIPDLRWTVEKTNDPSN